MAMEPVAARAAFVLLAAATPALAQYVTTPQPGQTSPPAAAPGARADELNVTPKNGQTQEQQWADRYECHRWAKTQSGFDPTQIADANAPDSGARREQYRRAFTACLEARGYAVRYGGGSGSAAPPAALPPPPPPTAANRRAISAAAAPKPRVLSMQLEGGYTIAAGSTGKLLDDGSNVGLGFTLFPIPAVPIGLRVDGSYSSFHARNALLDTGPGYTHGHENVYGGDADIQLDLAHNSPWMKLYLFGGAGWYREQTTLRQISWVNGQYCDWWGNCWAGVGPALTAYSRTTSPWHSAWNAGLGWEVSLANNASFFVEARYLRIAPRSDQMQFVPIRVGLRF